MNKFLPIIVDKSYLLTIGEKLYSESIELVRELVNNAYDADATDKSRKLQSLSQWKTDNGPASYLGNISTENSQGPSPGSIKTSSKRLPRLILIDRDGVL